MIESPIYTYPPHTHIHYTDTHALHTPTQLFLEHISETLSSLLLFLLFSEGKRKAYNEQLSVFLP